MSSGNVYQFKITLDNVRPTVWRRIQVPADYTMWDLDVAILNAMGWDGGHLHGFCTIAGQRGSHMSDVVHIGFPSKDFSVGDERKIWEESIADWFIPSMRDRMKHQYDYGDGWEHMIVLEKIVEAEKGMKYPRCIAGKTRVRPMIAEVRGGMELLEFIQTVRRMKTKKSSSSGLLATTESGTRKNLLPTKMWNFGIQNGKQHTCAQCKNHSINMFYYLDNQKPVDVDGAIEGMLDSERAHRYFLDLQKGEVGCIEANTKEGKESLESLAGDGKRYRQLPRVSDTHKQKWMREFITLFVEEENPIFAKQLRAALVAKRTRRRAQAPRAKG